MGKIAFEPHLKLVLISYDLFFFVCVDIFRINTCFDSKDSIEGRPTKDGIVRNRRFHSLVKKINEIKVSLGDFL